jgi:succinoglycan biosynthesis transport protein ExoP
MSQAVAAERRPEDGPRPAGGISSRVVFNAVRRHPVAFLGVLLFAIAASLGIWFFLPLPKKTAGVVFQVLSQPPSLLTSPGDTRADFASYKQAQIALIKSRRTFNKALNDPQVGGLEIIKNADPDAMTWLDKHVTVESKTGSEHIRVTIEGDSDRELLVLLGAITSAYNEIRDDRENGARAKRHRDLTGQVSELKKELEDKQQKINAIAEVIGGRGASNQALSEKLRWDAYTKAVEDRTAIDFELQTAAADLAAAKANVDALRQTVMLAVTGTPRAVFQPQGGTWRTERVTMIALEEALRQDRRLQELELHVVEAQEFLKKTLDSYAAGATNDRIDKAKADLKRAEEARDEYRDEAESRISASLRMRAAEVAEGVLAKVQADHDRIKAKHARAEARVTTLEEEIKRASNHKADLESRLAEIAHKEKIYNAMTEELEKLNVDLKAAKAEPRVSMVEDPFIINGIEGNRRLKYALMAGLGAFVLGFGGLVMWEHRGRRVTRTEEVSTELGTRLIGTIPPLAPVGAVAASHEANSPLVEAIDTTRIMLTHATADGSKLRVLMVTSAVSGEGKTTLSGNLAISLTRAGFRTLLIDGDMQAPSAHLLFDIPDAPGLSELLRGESDLARAIKPSPIPGLSILPAGRWNMSTRQSLVGDRWRILKRQLESEFDFVVIDTSPLLMVSDAMLLAREADGVVVSVLLGVSQIARVAETVNRLQAIGAELAGVVVNNVQSEVYRRYMSRAKYATPAPVAPDQDRLALAEETEGQEAMAEEIGAEPVGIEKEGQR